MCRRIVLSLTRLGLVAATVSMVATDAQAGCKNLPPYMCASWIRGSLFCENLIKGVASRLTKTCSASDPTTCTIDVTCSVFGTVGVDPNCADPTLIDKTAECSIEGKLACCNPQFHYNDNGTSFNLAGAPFNGDGTTTCTSGGKCRNSADIDFNLTDVCNNNWTPDFNPTEFKGEVCYCPAWNPSHTQCCESADFNPDGTCKKLFNGTGVQACLQEYCTIDPTLLQFCGDQPPIEYTCTVIE